VDILTTFGECVTKTAKVLNKWYPNRHSARSILRITSARRFGILHLEEISTYHIRKRQWSQRSCHFDSN